MGVPLPSGSCIGLALVIGLKISRFKSYPGDLGVGTEKGVQLLGKPGTEGTQPELVRLVGVRQVFVVSEKESLREGRGERERKEGRGKLGRWRRKAQKANMGQGPVLQPRPTSVSIHESSFLQLHTMSCSLRHNFPVWLHATELGSQYFFTNVISKEQSAGSLLTVTCVPSLCKALRRPGFRPGSWSFPRWRGDALFGKRSSVQYLLRGVHSLEG